MSKHGEVKTLYQANTDAEDKDSVSRIENMGEIEAFDTQQLDALKLVYPAMKNTYLLNVFRELRTSLLKSQNGKNFICMVTSVGFGGGASYVAKNLATAFALDKAKTSLLIDANLYGPVLEELIIGEPEFGITDYLSQSHLNIRDIVYATGVPRLRVVPLGDNKEGAAEFFSSQKMNQFVEEVRTRYPDRYIFLDAPPIAKSSEARILNEVADVVLLVVAHGQCTPAQINAAVDSVGKDKLLGLVYNN
ncbi:MAG: XRE family transcriptional regulator [Oleiphilus sp.]|nr:MAG: XRE family transcriptional regulator [Oleiphilus sp.]